MKGQRLRADHRMSSVNSIVIKIHDKSFITNGGSSPKSHTSVLKFEDLTQQDLQENFRWSMQVSKAYQEGNKHCFSRWNTV